MSAQVIVMAIPMSPGKPPNRWWHCCAGASWSSTTARWMSCSTSSACRVASVRMIRWDDPMVSWCWIWRTIWRTYFEICFYMIYMVETSWILVLKQVFWNMGASCCIYIYRDTWDYPCSRNVYDIILVGSTSIDAWRMSPCSIAKSSISQLHIVITIVKYISPLVHYPHYFCFSPSNITILTCQISERCWSLLVLPMLEPWSLNVSPHCGDIWLGAIPYCRSKISEKAPKRPTDQAKTVFFLNESNKLCYHKNQPYMFIFWVQPPYLPYVP